MKTSVPDEILLWNITSALCAMLLWEYLIPNNWDNLCIHGLLRNVEFHNNFVIWNLEHYLASVYVYKNIYYIYIYIYG